VRFELLILIQFYNTKKGAADEAPFNAIHVGAAATSVPKALIAQLAPGGRMIIPVGPPGGHQELLQIDKDPESGALSEQSICGVIYVPLVGDDDDSSSADNDK